MTEIEELIKTLEADPNGPDDSARWQKANLLSARLDWAEPRIAAHHDAMIELSFTFGLPNLLIPVAAAFVPENWSWLVRTDEEVGGFANITSPDFIARGAVVPEGMSGQEAFDHVEELLINHTLSGHSFPAYGKTPARALLLAGMKLRAEFPTNDRLPSAAGIH